jgi:hypothetical protein
LSLIISGEVCADAIAGTEPAFATVVGACDAICAEAMAALRRIEMKSWDFILPRLLISCRYIVHFVCRLSCPGQIVMLSGVVRRA